MENKNKFSSIYVFIALLVLFTVVPLSVHFYTSNDGDSENNPIKEVNIVNLDNTPVSFKESTDLSKVLGHTSADNITNYLLSSDKKIQDANSQADKDVLLLRKAVMLSLNRDTNFVKNQKEANDIYTDIINRNSSTSPLAAYLRNFSIVSMVKLNSECCSDDPSGLFSKDILGIKGQYDLYLKKGYSKDLTRLLTLIYINSRADQYYKSDFIYNANMLDLSSRVLMSYEKQLLTEDKDSILSLIENSLNKKNIQALTSKDAISIDLFYRAIYALAFDVFNSYKKNSSEYKNIDDYYEIVSIYYNNPDIDSVSINQVKFYNNIRYLYSLNKRYGSSSDMKNKQDIVVQRILENINSSKELQSLASNYFNSDDMKTGLLMGRYFISLRSVNLKIDTYLKSIGI